MTTARDILTDQTAEAAGASRRAAAASRQPTSQDALLGAAERIKRRLGEATAQLERLEGRFDLSSAGPASPPKPQPASRANAGAVAAAEARVQMAFAGVLVALRDMGLPRTAAAR